MANNGQFFVEGNVVAQENAQFMTRVYQWMTIGVLLTSLIAGLIGRNVELVQTIMINMLICKIITSEPISEINNANTQWATRHRGISSRDNWVILIVE